MKNSCSLAICQKLQTREEIFLKQHKKFQIKKKKTSFNK
jgi:hypothetical protein